MRLVLLAVLLAAVVIPPPSSAYAQGGPCSMLDPASREYADWSGPWASHARSIDVKPSGCGTLAWDGGLAGFILDTRDGMATSGRIVLISDPQAIAGDGIVLRLNDDGTLAAEWDGEQRTFCRTWLWSDRCGA